MIKHPRTNSFDMWQVDAFTNEPFKGNPAAIVVLDDALDDLQMQNIAMEMNLSETAFILLNGDNAPLLQWFTPTSEIDLCGHATLASAHIYLNNLFPEKDTVTFETKYAGPLSVTKTSQQYCMDFPLRLSQETSITDYT